MESQNSGRTVRVGPMIRLNASNAGEFQRSAIAALQPGAESLEIDLSQTVQLDGSGLAALLVLNRHMLRRGGRLRLLDPSPAAMQFMEFTRIDRLLHIAEAEEAERGPSAAHTGSAPPKVQWSFAML